MVDQGLIVSKYLEAGILFKKWIICLTDLNYTNNFFNFSGKYIWKLSL